MDLTRLVPVLTLLLLVPVAMYIQERSAQIVVLSAVCVLLVTASLFLMVGPSDHATSEPVQ
jgi:hypothetical protein